MVYMATLPKINMLPWYMTAEWWYRGAGAWPVANALCNAMHITPVMNNWQHVITEEHTHLFNGPLSGTTRWAGTRKVKPIGILLKQETVSGNDISWAICKSAPRSRQITMPATHHSVFYRPDALPAAQPTASKHWRQKKTVQLHGSSFPLRCFKPASTVRLN